MLFLSVALAQESAGSDSATTEQRAILGDEADQDDQVCVTLAKFGSGCKGTVKDTNIFTALTKPGSPCKHTVKMKDNSAKDQFCTFHEGVAVFHQTVYVRNKHCAVDWEEKAISPMKLKYTTDFCTYGYKLKSCTLGPCSDSPGLFPGDMEQLLGDFEFIEHVGRHLRPGKDK